MMAQFTAGQRGRRRQRDLPDVKTVAPGLTQRADALEQAERHRAKPPPAYADESRWDDPEDHVNTRSPKQVRGFRRGDVLGRLHRRGKDITRDHIEAARAFRCDWDLTAYGLTGADTMLTGPVGGAAGPTTGPKAHEVARIRASREIERVHRAIGPGAWPLLLWVVVRNLDVTAWCTALRELEPWTKPDPKKELGKLIHILTRLAEHYGIDSRRDAAKQARRELAQR